jgi:aryl-alcohol dehydrogenase (NADP+)
MAVKRRSFACARKVAGYSQECLAISKVQYTADLRDWTRFFSMQNHYNLLHREEEHELLPLCLI